MKISQREARRMRKELKALHERDAARERSWSSDYPGGIHIATSSPNADVVAIIKTARKLGHAVVAMADDLGKILYYAAPKEIPK
jgi:hypothetical protein